MDYSFEKLSLNLSNLFIVVLLNFFFIRSHPCLFFSVYCVSLAFFYLIVWVIDQARGQHGWILAKLFFCV